MTLAIKGGTPVRTTPFPKYNTIGEEEKDAVVKVIESGVLSNYLGAWHEQFYGGDEVKRLEAKWASTFNTKHAISVNSNTSGLFASIGALGIEPQDEVIVTPYSMCASATAPLIYNAIPVFADIEENYFCLDPKSVEEKITPRTKAIIAVNIFGHPYENLALRKIADKHGLKIIEDNAQAPYASDNGVLTGSLGDLAVYSLNYHKHIHSGEGGIVVTNHDELAERVRLIRNHAEAVVEAKGETNLTNMVGYNFRMTELEAAISRAQLRKLPSILKQIRDNCQYLARGLSEIPAITVPKVREGCTHSYYIFPVKFKSEGISRAKFLEAVTAELAPIAGRENEGVQIKPGYVRPLYLMPVFQKAQCYGTSGFPFTGKENYSKGICPVVERMHFEEVIVFNEHFKPPMTRADLDDVVEAFQKVWRFRNSLK